MQRNHTRAMPAMSAIMLLAMSLAACSSDTKKVERREAYLDADYYSRLELPPDLTAPANAKELIIPQPSVPAQQRFRKQVESLVDDEAETENGDDTATSAARPAAPVAVLAGAAVRQDGERSWIEIGQDPQQIWSVIDGFLLNEGLPVKREEPQIGLLETDWVSKYQIPEGAGFLSKVMAKFEPDLMDRFTFRIERAPEGDGSRVFVTHAGIERDVVGEDIGWRSRPADTGMAVEMLQRFALYLGVDGASMDTANYRPFAQLMRESDYSDNSIEVIGDVAHVQQRVSAALRSLNIDDIAAGASANELLLTVDEDSSALATVEEDEYAQSSFLMQMFSGNDEDGNRFVLRFTELDAYTRLDINDSKGELSDSVLAEQISAKLKALLL